MGDAGETELGAAGRYLKDGFGAAGVGVGHVNVDSQLCEHTARDTSDVRKVIARHSSRAVKIEPGALRYTAALSWQCREVSHCHVRLPSVTGSTTGDGMVGWRKSGRLRNGTGDNAPSVGELFSAETKCCDVGHQTTCLVSAKWQATG